MMMACFQAFTVPASLRGARVSSRADGPEGSSTIECSYCFCARMDQTPVNFD